MFGFRKIQKQFSKAFASLTLVAALTAPISLVLGSLLILVSPAIAATPSTGTGSVANQGLTVSPFLMERQMQKGQTLNEIIEVTNNSNRTLPVDISVADFLPKGDNGEQQFLDRSQSDPHYSLASWITIKNNPSQVLAANQKTQINFSITPPANAEDGGHYGAVLFSFQGAPVQGTAVSVSQKIGSIILVKLGKVKESGSISSFAPTNNFSNYPPIDLQVRFHNDGNVHVKPRGGIKITNMFGKEIATVLVNANANNVLPNSDRVFTSTWNDSFAFGLYRAHVQLAYGDSGAVVESDTSFWVIPVKLTLIVAAVLFILIFLLTYGVRRYNRWLISKVNNNQRRK